MIELKNLNIIVTGATGIIGSAIIEKLFKAGANIIVSGSTIFKENNGDLKKNIGLLRSS